MPVALAIHHFLEVHGIENGWPGAKALRHFALLAETAVAGYRGPWSAQIEAARALRASRGLPSPAGAAASQRPRASIQAPAAPLEGSVPPRDQRRHSKADCLADLRTYDEDAPAGVRRTQAGYRAYATKHGLIAASGLQRHGRFQELLREARSS